MKRSNLLWTKLCFQELNEESLCESENNLTMKESSLWIGNNQIKSSFMFWHFWLAQRNRLDVNNVDDNKVPDHLLQLYRFVSGRSRKNSLSGEIRLICFASLDLCKSPPLIGTPQLSYWTSAQFSAADVIQIKLLINVSFSFLFICLTLLNRLWAGETARRCHVSRVYAAQKQYAWSHFLPLWYWHRNRAGKSDTMIGFVRWLDSLPTITERTSIAKA